LLDLKQFLFKSIFLTISAQPFFKQEKAATGNPADFSPLSYRIAGLPKRIAPIRSL
jgi:hypothetical protein